jgi:hypothetical protein
MANYQVVNWDKLFPANVNLADVLRDNDAMKNFGEAIAHYFALPSLNPPAWLPQSTELQNFRRDKRAFFEHGYQIQNIATTSSFEEFYNNLQARFKTMPIYDEGYKLIYRDIPLSGTDGWDVQTMSSSVTFQKILPGGKIQYHGASDTKYHVYIDFYGGGVGIDMRLIMTRQWVQIEDMLSFLRNSAYLKKAQVHYALIEAVGSGQNITWQNPDPSTLPNTDSAYTANRDVQTLNKAAETLITNLKDIGLLPNGMATTFIVLAPFQLQTRLRKALNVSMQAYDSSVKLSNYMFQPIYTTLLSSATSYYVIVPGGKIQTAELLSLTQFQQFNQTNYTQDIANWMAYGATIGSELQVQRCAIS